MDQVKKTKADLLLGRLNTESGEDFHEMANLPKQDTGIPYIVHIRTRAETPGHPGTPSLKIYSGRPSTSDSFTISISKSPKAVAGADGDFYKSVSSKDLRKINKWVIKNSDKLLDFYSSGMDWTTADIVAWEKTLEKI